MVLTDIERCLTQMYPGRFTEDDIRRSRYIEDLKKRYAKRFKMQDYSTEERMLSPEEMYAQMEICLKEGKPFSSYFPPLDADALY